MPVLAMARLTDLLAYLAHRRDPALAFDLARVTAYRERYGV